MPGLAHRQVEALEEQVVELQAQTAAIMQMAAAVQAQAQDLHELRDIAKYQAESLDHYVTSWIGAPTHENPLPSG